MHTNSCRSRAEGCCEVAGGRGGTLSLTRPSCHTGLQPLEDVLEQRDADGRRSSGACRTMWEVRGGGEGPLTACYTTVSAPFPISTRKTILWTSSTVTSSVNSFSDSQALLHCLLLLREWSHQVPLSLLNSHILSLPCSPSPST